MSIQNFIPICWTNTLEQSIMEKQTVASYVMRIGGEISQWGDTLNIDCEKNIRVKAYEPDTDVEPDGILIIDHGAYYNFFVNDADRVQRSLSLMKETMETTAERLAADSERYLVSKICQSAGTRMKAKLPETNDECCELIERMYSCMKEKRNTSAVVSIIVPMHFVDIMMGDRRLIFEKMNRFEQEDVLSMRFCGIPVIASEDTPTAVIAMEHNAVWFAGKVTRVLPTGQKEGSVMA